MGHQLPQVYQLRRASVSTAQPRPNADVSPCPAEPILNPVYALIPLPPDMHYATHVRLRATGTTCYMAPSLRLPLHLLGQIPQLGSLPTMRPLPSRQMEPAMRERMRTTRAWRVLRLWDRVRRVPEAGEDASLLGLCFVVEADVFEALLVRRRRPLEAAMDRGPRRTARVGVKGLTTGGGLMLDWGAGRYILRWRC